MSISMRKVCAVVWAKSRALTDKNVILAPLMILGITVGLRYLYGAMMEGEALSPSLMAMVLNMGLTMNITMTGMFVTSAGRSGIFPGQPDSAFSGDAVCEYPADPGQRPFPGTD